MIGGAEEDIVNAIAVAPDQSVYVTGSLRGATLRPTAVSLPPMNTAGGSDLVVLGLQNDGGAIFLARRMGAVGAVMVGLSVAAATNGDVVLSSVYGGGATVHLGTATLTQAAGEPVLALPGDEVVYSGSHRGALTLPGSGAPGVQLQAQPSDDAYLARNNAAGGYLGHVRVTTGGDDAVLALGLDRGDALHALGLAPGTGRIGDTTVNPPLSPFLLRRDGSMHLAAGAVVTGSVAATLTVRGMAFDRLGAVAFVGSSTADTSTRWAMFGRGDLMPGAGSRTWLAIYPRP